MKSGREKSAKYKWLIDTLKAVFGITPRFVRVWVYDLISPFTGDIAVMMRYVLISSQCKSIGECVFIGPNVRFVNLKGLTIGSNCSIHANSYVDAYGGVFIGNNVSIAHNSSLISFDHTWDDRGRAIKYNDVVCAPVVICDDVWIGCGCRILCGAKVNTRVVIAAGAVVLSSELDSGYLYGGVPSKKIKRL